MESTLIFIVFVILVLAGIFVWLYRNNSRSSNSRARSEQRSDLVTIRSYDGRPEAEAAKTFLAENGIPATVIVDDAGGMRPDLLMAMGGARLVVRNQDADRALEMLEPLPY